MQPSPTSTADRSLFLAFSFSLSADGSAGSYNQKIASGLRDDIRVAAKSNSVFAAMQWEIHDALVGSDKSATEANVAINKAYISPPPLFIAQDINCNLLAAQLGQGATLAQRLLTQQLDLIHPQWTAAEHMLNSLNTLLTNRKLFRLFENCVELHDLHRSILGSVGSEVRQLPRCADYPNDLAEFQTIRVNRLILEAVCPIPESMRRGDYLSTKGVLDFILPQLAKYKDQITQVYIYGHPNHSRRCHRQTLSSLEQHGWPINPAAVYDVHRGQRWPWDNTSAQVWCRTEQNWQDYETLVSSLIA